MSILFFTIGKKADTAGQWGDKLMTLIAEMHDCSASRAIPSLTSGLIAKSSAQIMTEDAVERFFAMVDTQV
jgi:hypothetical protein